MILAESASILGFIDNHRGPPMTRLLNFVRFQVSGIVQRFRFRTAVAVACGLALVAAGVHVHAARFAAVSVADAADLSSADPQGEAPAEDADADQENSSGKESGRDGGTLAGDLGRPALGSDHGWFFRCDRHPCWEPRARRGDLTARGPPTPA